MSNNKIFIVTTIRHALNVGSRAVGYFNTFKEAEDALVNNIMDINECGYYPFAVIEPTTPGFYTIPREEFWYRWNNDIHEYEPCPKPERFNKICGWGLG